ITKLMAKRETVAAPLYDRTRFRIVTKSKDDILPIVYHLTQRLFPFNFVVPKQTQNTLISFKDLVERDPHLQQAAAELHWHVEYEEPDAAEPHNVFSGPGYRILNFVVDVPLRLDAYLPPPEQDYRPRKCRIGFVNVEFQVCDQATALENELGENSHERYKE